MVALPMVRLGRVTHARRTPGVHHGCGHDGHISMLIDAAQQLTHLRNFDGTVHFIFQQAEEGKRGHSHNVLPAEASLTGTVRGFDAQTQDRVEAALHA